MLPIKNRLFFNTALIVVIILSSVIIVPLQVYAQEAVTPFIRVERIKFYWGPSSGAIQMLDHETDKVLPVPEWDYSARINKPACYVRNTQFVIQAQFKLLRYTNFVSRVRIWANGSLGGVEEKLVTFKNGWSDYVAFTVNEPLPNYVCVTNVTWNWYYRDVNGLGTAPTKMTVSSTHEIIAVWKTPLYTPIYEKVVRWTTQWCTGAGDLNTTKDICDSIISKEYLSGLHYGYPAWSVDDILDIGGGMCGGWYKMFHEMAAGQGVYVYDRCYILKRDCAPSPEIKWIGIVIKDPGLNNPEPTWPVRWWYDVDGKYPYPSDLDIHAVYEKRYIFYSPYDGHCVNFLLFEGKVYLYDASFGTGPWAEPFDHIPSGDYKGTALHNFRVNYHDIAIDHMEGTIYKAGGTTATLDVKSSLIPDLRNPDDPTTFEMHYYFTGSMLEEKMETLKTIMTHAGLTIFAETEASTVFQGEYAECVRKVKIVVENSNKPVDWFDILNAIVRLGEIGDPNALSVLFGVLNRNTDLVVSDGVLLPSSMSPLDMLKSAAIDSIISILT